MFARLALAAGRQAEALPWAQEAVVQAASFQLTELSDYGQMILAVIEEVDEAGWAPVARRAAESQNSELFLGVLEMEARRLWAAGDIGASKGRWRTLQARSRELGYRPGEEESQGWLDLPDEP